MTLADAISVLEKRGLLISHGADGLTAAFGGEVPHPQLRAQGVSDVYAFGFSIRRVNGIWLLRHELPPAPATEFASLQDAVTHGLALFEEYLASSEP